MSLDDKIAVWIQHGGGAEETEDERGPHGGDLEAPRPGDPAHGPVSVASGFREAYFL